MVPGAQVGARLVIPADGPDDRTITTLLVWLADQIAAGQHGVLIVPTLRQLDDGGVFAVVVGSDAAEVARRDRIVIELDDRLHEADVRTEATYKPVVEYRLVDLALALLWPPDSLLRRIDRDSARAEVLAISWAKEQADRWATRLGYSAFMDDLGKSGQRVERP